MGPGRRRGTSNALGNRATGPSVEFPKDFGPTGTNSPAMRRWTMRLLLTSWLVGAVLLGCDDSSTSDSDSGIDARHGSGGRPGAGGAVGNGGAQPSGGAPPQGGAMSTGGRSTGLQWGDGGLPDRFLLPDLPPLPDLGLWQGGVPPCDASVQKGGTCLAGPATACVPTGSGAVCLCPAGTWMCF
jgi:hypothetical protein